MVKRIVSILLLLVVLAVSTVAVGAGDVTYLLDKAGDGIIEDHGALTALLIEASTEKDAYFVVVTTDVSYDGDVEAAGRKLCYEAGLNYRSDDVILMVINMADRTYDLFLWGWPDQEFSRGDVDDVLDAMESQMRSGDYDGAVRSFVRAAKEACLSGQQERSGMGVYILGGIITMLVVAGAFVGIVTLRYKMKLTPTNYPLNEFTQLDLKDQDDVFLTRNVIRTVVQSSSSGGGGSRGGHAGGRGF